MSTLDALKQMGTNSHDLLNNLKAQQGKSAISELAAFFENILEDQQKKTASLKDQMKKLDDKASKLAKDSEELVAINKYVDEKLLSSKKSMPSVNNSQTTTVEKTKYLVDSQEAELKEMQAELTDTKRELDNAERELDNAQWELKRAWEHSIHFHIYSHLDSEDQLRVDTYIERISKDRFRSLITRTKEVRFKRAIETTSYFKRECDPMPELPKEGMAWDEYSEKRKPIYAKAWKNIVGKLTKQNGS